MPFLKKRFVWKVDFVNFKEKVLKILSKIAVIFCQSMKSRVLTLL